MPRALAWRMVGDPTEGAMVVAAAKGGFWARELEKSFPRVQEIPFDSDRKRMTTIHRRDGSDFIAFVKARPTCSSINAPTSSAAGQAVPLGEDKRKEVLDQNLELARAALRVLAVAYRPLREVPANPKPQEVERDLVFVGLLGMIDPARPEVRDAIKVAQGAGLRSVMVTGDHKETAEAIARDIGLLGPRGLVLTGPEIEKLSDAELAAKVDTLEVCCRVSPQHKMRIVDAFKSRDHVVAMTGDGVNDAPALKRASIGVAMGITGTDVTKQTADMVLTDDNYASIVTAIEQGRIISFEHPQVRLLPARLQRRGDPHHLRRDAAGHANSPAAGSSAVAEPGERRRSGARPGDGKRRPGHHEVSAPAAEEPVINRDMAIGIGVIAVVDAIAILSVFYLALQRYPGHLEAAQTIAFVTLCYLRADPRVYGALRVPERLRHRPVLQQVDELGGPGVVPPGPDGRPTCRSCNRSSTPCRSRWTTGCSCCPSSSPRRSPWSWSSSTSGAGPRARRSSLACHRNGRPNVGVLTAVKARASRGERECRRQRHARMVRRDEELTATGGVMKSSFSKFATGGGASPLPRSRRRPGSRPRPSSSSFRPAPAAAPTRWRAPSRASSPSTTS